MSLIISGKTFNDGEQLTAAKLNQILGEASLSTTGVDGSTIIVNTSDVLAVRTGGIGSSSLAIDSVITNKLPDSTVTETDGTPDGVTFPKIQHIETNKILGRTTEGDGIVEAIGLNTDNAMASSSATSLATDGSIKAYVDSAGIKQTVLSEATTEITTYEVVSGSDTTPPLITAGVDTGLLCTMTPISTSNTIRASLKARFRNQAAGQAIIITLFEDDLAVGVSSVVQPPTGYGPHTHTWYFNAANTTEHEYTVRFGTTSSSYYSTMDTSPSFGGLTKSTLFIEEIAG